MVTITVEGPHKSGKSAAARLIAAALEEAGASVSSSAADGYAITLEDAKLIVRCSETAFKIED